MQKNEDLQKNSNNGNIMNWRPDFSAGFTYCPRCDLKIIVSQLLIGTEIRYFNGHCCDDENNTIEFSGLRWYKDLDGFNHYRFDNDTRRKILSKEPFLSEYNKMKSVN